jgi:hypothetical protein
MIPSGSNAIPHATAAAAPPLGASPPPGASPLAERPPPPRLAPGAAAPTAQADVAALGTDASQGKDVAAAVAPRQQKAPAPETGGRAGAKGPRGVRFDLFSSAKHDVVKAADGEQEADVAGADVGASSDAGSLDGGGACRPCPCALLLACLSSRWAQGRTAAQRGSMLLSRPGTHCTALRAPPAPCRQAPQVPAPKVLQQVDRRWQGQLKRRAGVALPPQRPPPAWPAAGAPTGKQREARQRGRGRGVVGPVFWGGGGRRAGAEGTALAGRMGLPSVPLGVWTHPYPLQHACPARVHQLKHEPCISLLSPCHESASCRCSLCSSLGIPACISDCSPALTSLAGPASIVVDPNTACLPCMLHP